MLQSDADTLRARIESLELELGLLKQQLSEVEWLAASSETAAGAPPHKGPPHTIPTPNAGLEQTWPLSGDEYTRYGRQMIMPEIGLQG